MKKQPKEKMPIISITGRSWALMIVGTIVFLVGATVVTLGCLHFAVFGWLVASIMIVGGLSSMYLSVAAMVEGKPEWLLLDLIIPS